MRVWWGKRLGAELVEWVSILPRNHNEAGKVPIWKEVSFLDDHWVTRVWDLAEKGYSNRRLKSLGRTPNPLNRWAVAINSNRAQNLFVGLIYPQTETATCHSKFKNTTGLSTLWELIKFLKKVKNPKPISPSIFAREKKFRISRGQGGQITISTRIWKISWNTKHTVLKSDIRIRCNPQLRNTHPKSLWNLVGL